MKYDPAFIEAIKRYIKAFRIYDALRADGTRKELDNAESHLDSFGGEKK